MTVILRKFKSRAGRGREDERRTCAYIKTHSVCTVGLNSCQLYTSHNKNTTRYNKRNVKITVGYTYVLNMYVCMYTYIYMI